MSVNLVFGRNLRHLSRANGSQMKAAEALGVSRVQFQRYLRGESFPKPSLLKRICDQFEVDARILTEELDDGLRENMRRGRTVPAHSGSVAVWAEALSSILPDFECLAGPHGLGQGIYSVWRRSSLRPAVCYRGLIQVMESHRVKVIKGYEPRSLYPDGHTPHQRRYRGIALRLPSNGYALLVFHPGPVAAVSMAYVMHSVISNVAQDWVGFVSLARPEMQRTSRSTRLLMRKETSSPADPVRLAHAPVFYRQEELPQSVRERLEIDGI